MQQHGINATDTSTELVSYLDFCIDLETLNTNRMRPCIIQCGVVASLTNTNQLETIQQLDTRIVQVSQYFPVYPKHLAEADTIAWWTNDDRRWLFTWIRNQALEAGLGRLPFLTALTMDIFNTTSAAKKAAAKLGSKLVVKFWANSPTFDLVMLESEFKAMNMNVPWSYKEEMDIRTIRSLLVCPSHHREALAHRLSHSLPDVDIGYLVPHNAVYDAYAELLDVLWVRSSLWEAGKL